MLGPRLLFKKRFGPFFWTQALGAFNDNVFRFALMFTLTFTAADQLALDINILMNLAAGLFILPFFLFSGIAGQLADKYEKSLVVRRIKLLELLIMLVALAAFAFQLWGILLALVFAMGVQSALFGPVKYALLPQHLKQDELVTGNAFVGMGTFVAILCGTLLGGLLAGWASEQPWIIGLAVVSFAILGVIASLKVPLAAAGDPELKINWNIYSQTRKVLGEAVSKRSVFLAILAISWFWFMGSGYLTQFPNFTRSVLGSDEGVGTLLLTLFSLGVGAGALLCGYWSRGKIELGMVPLGALGMAVFSFDLYSQAAAFPALMEGENLRSLSQFLALGGVRLAIDLTLAGVSGGLFIVPLYSLVQRRSPVEVRAQVIAALNVLNSLAMVLSALAGILVLGVLGISLPVFFFLYGLTALVVAFLAVKLARDPLLRFLIYLLSHTLYRVKHRGLENIPETGPALVVANHVSYVDALLLAGACHRPLRFVIDKDIHDLPVLKRFLQLAGTVPLTSEKIDRQNLQEAFARIGETLQKGELVFIFPEGRLTRDGELQTFKKGVERILAQHPVPVIPMALRGLWGSWFSREKGSAFKKVPRRFWSRVEVVAGPALQPEEATAERLQEQVAALRGDWR
ncbi:1-acyl-sn-glycerol-3-phosphate acyltransferases [Marinospirillum celere]|uniref:1-acyl-sn-glycerol-3-phosphate acyltransferases n=1 Tax=Marinospirillum celere TaxID=1122252 RepID=A0A1I1JNE1_9GAMM|nr:MFS transporter [Marinospirillum celere]SFC48068.1 1-acyl-sn-glycerol-3-phosphate acyltransferases [Marinospirillum celere]